MLRLDASALHAVEKMTASLQYQWLLTIFSAVRGGTGFTLAMVRRFVRLSFTSRSRCATIAEVDFVAGMLWLDHQDWLDPLSNVHNPRIFIVFVARTGHLVTSHDDKVAIMPPSPCAPAWPPRRSLPLLTTSSDPPTLHLVLEPLPPPLTSSTASLLTVEDLPPDLTEEQWLEVQKVLPSDWLAQVVQLPPPPPPFEVQALYEKMPPARPRLRLQ